MDTFSQAAWLVPLFPLAAFLVLLAVGRGARRVAPQIGMVGSLGAFVLSLLILMERLKPAAVDFNNGFDWIRLGDYTLRIGYEITNLTALMLAMVSLVSLLVQLYSSVYMKTDERITVYYSYLSLFGFAMLGLVLSDNLLSLYLFWELVGVCSFLLIGFWYARPQAKAAAKKAFIVTRIGDAGLLLGILLLFWHMPEHALDFTTIQSVFGGQSGMLTSVVTTAIALLIFLGAMGKSGQFPLHVWLPDAMEGPTPVSALIHAATMVAAGVFLVARTYDIFQASAVAMHTVAYVGGFTALLAATIALLQQDFKRILAYSTVSQLGYMMMALGLGSLSGGLFHLFTHAFFKALLFLGAGSVIHALHTQNIKEMGGVGTRMKLTTWTFAIGALALAGIPPLSGFWSKELILTAAFETNALLFAVGLAASFLTALYMTRLFIVVFLGRPGALRSGEPVRADADLGKVGQIGDEGLKRALWAEMLDSSKENRKMKEGPQGSPRATNAGRRESWAMTLPLVVLAALAAVAGFAETPWRGWLGSWLTGVETETHASGVVIVASIAAAGLGLYVGWLVYGKGGVNRPALAGKAPWLFKLVERGYYMDELYAAVIVKPLKLLGSGLLVCDEYIVGGIVRLTGAVTLSAGRLAARLQNGQAQSYGLAALVGLVIVLAALLGRRLLS
jgi:NADH-quinone oxidoreductase subunit L